MSHPDRPTQFLKRDPLGLAEGALSGLSDKDKVNFVLALLMKTTDPDAVAALRSAGNQLVALSDTLMREAYEQECG